jgi:hypothetical protein
LAEVEEGSDMASAPGTASEPEQQTHSPEDRKMRWELFNEQKRQIWTDSQSSSDSYDKAILTLSSGALALSVGFIKDVVPLKSAIYLPVLFTAWAAFVVAILLTVISFRLSISAQGEQLDNAYEYYLNYNDEAGKKKTRFSFAIKCCAFVGGGAFVLGFVLNVMFAAVNILKAVTK